MRAIMLSAAAAAALLTVVPNAARAECWNPAICKAVCGCTCCTTHTGCGGGGFAVKTGRDASQALKGFSTQDLQQEASRGKNNAAMKRVLQSEIKTRGN